MTQGGEKSGNAIPLESLIVFGLFFVSGIAGLIYEVVWIRMMVSTFGATVHAVAMVVTAFMAGLALGSWGGGRKIDNTRNPIAVYAALEVGIAASAFALPALLALSDKGYVAACRLFPENLPVLTLLRFLLSLAPLLIPTTLMGATLPVISKHLAKNPRTLAYDVGALYSLNVVGAVLGAYLAGFVLIGQYGLRRTILVAMALNGLAALLAGALTFFPLTNNTPPVKTPLPPPGKPIGQTSSLRTLLAVFFATGFTSLAYQILWTKGLSLFVDNTVYSYSAMLVTFLAGLGIGGFVWSRFLKWETHLPLRLAALQWAIGVYGALTIPLLHGLDRYRLLDRWPGGGDSLLAFSGPYFAATLPVLFIPTLLMGISFPLIVKLLVQDPRVLGARLGQAYAINTVGAIAGSLAAGFVLLPLLGIQKSILAVSALSVGIGWTLARNSIDGNPTRKGLFWAGVWAFVALFGVAIKSEKPLILSTATFRQKDYGQRDLLFYKEDVTAVVTVRRLKTGEKLLEINGKSVAGTAYEYENTQKMQGHLPLLLLGNAKRVLQVGFGSGGSLYAISRHSGVEEIHCAEICDSVMDAAPFFRDQNHDILKDPRLAIIHDDAVDYVRTTDRTYDLIMSDSIHPTYAGNGALYSADYFAKCKERLRPGGMMSFWFPLYSLSQDDYRIILRSFVKVFPHAGLWYVNTNVNPYTIIVGSQEPFSVDVKRLIRDFSDPAVAGDLKQIGVASPYDLLNCFVTGEEALRKFCGTKGPINTDQRPIIEFSVPRLRSIGREGSWRLNFQDVVNARTSILPFLSYGDLSETDRKKINGTLTTLYNGTTPLLEGQIAQLAGRRDVALRLYENALSVNPECPGAKTLLEYLYREKGEQFRRAKKLDQAIAQYQLALVYSPTSPKSHNNLGTLFLSSGNKDQAEYHFKQAILYDPAYLTPRLNLGFLYREEGQTERAAQQFRDALEIDPANPVAREALHGLPIENPLEP